MTIKMEQLNNYVLIETPKNIKFYENLLANKDIHNTINPKHDEFMKQLLENIIGDPYPALQIINNIAKNSKTLNKIIFAAYKEICSKDLQNEENVLKLLNFLANFDDAAFPQEVLENILQSIYQHRKILGNKIYLCFLGRMDFTLLKNYLHIEQNSIEFPNHKYILEKIIKDKEHCIISAVKQNVNVLTTMIKDTTLSNNLIILKQINEFKNENKIIGDVKFILDAIQNSNLLSGSLKLFYFDLYRIQNLIELLKKSNIINCTQIKLKQLMAKQGILNIFYMNKQQIKTTYDDIKKLLEKDFELSLKVNDNNDAKTLRNYDLEIFSYFFIIKTIFEIISTSNNKNKPKSNYYEHKIIKLKIIIRQLKDIDILCNLFEDIFRLIFIRREYLENHKNNSNFSINKTVVAGEDPNKLSLSGTDLDTVMSTSNQPKNGFICTGSKLKIILEFLKNFITKRFHSEEFKNANDEIKLKFTKYSECINDGLWKLSLLDKCIINKQNTIDINIDEILPIVTLHYDNFEKTSSDDDDIIMERNYSSLRRKMKNRSKRLSLGGNTSSQSKISNEKRKEDRSVISKMLSSPESMGILALDTENFNDVKYIIQTYNLHNTQLAKELIYIENLQYQRKRLQSIYEEYKLQEVQTDQNQSVIERIKKVAAIGFEVSKIINIIEKYIQTHQIEQTDEIKNLLEKYSKNENYQYLQQYIDNQIQIIGIVDLILNLNFNYEICCNIMNIIKRVYDKKNINIYKGIGYIPLFMNVTDCMRIFKNNKINIGIQELLCETTYSLRPSILSKKLEKENSFYFLFDKNEIQISNFEDLKSLSKYFDVFKAQENYYLRFLNYMKNFSKLLKLHDTNMEYNLNEMIKIDPKVIIGNLIFDNNMTPMEIENYVISLNLNLIHVISIYICPEISTSFKDGKYFNNDNKKVIGNIQIYNYISSQNLLLGYLLQKINRSYQSEQLLEYSQINIKEECFERFVDLEEIKVLSKFYNNNKYIAAILSDNIDLNKLHNLENDENKLLILNYFREHKTPLLIEKQDELIVNLILKHSKYIYLIEIINDISIKSKILCDNIYQIKNSNIAESLIKSILSDRKINHVDANLVLKLKKLLNNIKIYSKITHHLSVKNWNEAYEISTKSPNIIVNKLLVSKHYNLLYKWSEILSYSTLSQYSKIFLDLILYKLIEIEDQSYEFLLKFIEKYPINEVIQFYDTNKEKFHNLPLLTYVIKFLSTNSNVNSLENYEISIKIFGFMSKEEQNLNWNLLSKPLLLIELCIMNSKFQLLEKILKCIKPLLDTEKNCKFCTDKHAGNIYDIYTPKQSNQLTLLSKSKDSQHTTNTEFILLNFNLYQKDHTITISCIDLLLRIYSTKALDYQINENYSSSERISSQSNDMVSLDSLCETFVIPKVAPSKQEWVRDEDTLYCMCCRRSVFTMLIRRHHCRRCGRVVCFACSTNRMKITELYDEVLVRVCNDCFKYTQNLENRNTTIKSKTDRNLDPRCSNLSNGDDCKWQLSGNLTHDKLLREEFCYEHAPSVALCLSILTFHTNNLKCINLLLYHCRKLEKLLIPNPEVDFSLVAKMMNSLAFAAKVRGGPTEECDTIRTHSDIIKSIVENGCESLLPAEPLNNHSLRKLGDSLVLVEKWQLALEVFLKCGFPTTGVLAAHGLSCLRAGCFETAREKLSYCMPALCSKGDGSRILKFITSEYEIDMNRDINIPIIKRPNRSPPLLDEIVKIIETSSNILHQPETITRASLIRTSNTSLASTRSKRSSKQNIPINEPALNILQIIENLKNISRGVYSDENLEIIDNKKFILRQSRIFEECLYYILLYGSHTDVINFLIRHKEIVCALKYYNLQKISDSDIFIQTIYLKFLKTGNVEQLIKHMLEIDERLLIWKDIIIIICRYLETKQLLNSLYQLQMLLKDPVRASMTCVKFYSMNCTTFNELQNNSFHLKNAHRHLQSELELCQWENININKKQQSPIESTFLMQMDAKTLNAHINTILKQLEITKFLAKTETSDIRDDQLTPDKMLKQIKLDGTGIPTLFDTIQEKIQLCILILMCGKNIDEGFGLAFRLIQDYKLPAIKIYGATAKYLTRNNRLNEIDKLIENVSSNSGNINKIKNTDVTDEILSISIHSAINIHEIEMKTILDQLIKRINNIEMQISCHIYIGQLKSAYLLAIQHNRLNDVRRILRQAEITNQMHIKKLCEKKLNINRK